MLILFNYARSGHRVVQWSHLTFHLGSVSNIMDVNNGFLNTLWPKNSPAHPLPSATQTNYYNYLTQGLLFEKEQHRIHHVVDCANVLGQQLHDLRYSAGLKSTFFKIDLCRSKPWTLLTHACTDARTHAYTHIHTRAQSRVYMKYNLSSSNASHFSVNEKFMLCFCQMIIQQYKHLQSISTAAMWEQNQNGSETKIERKWNANENFQTNVKTL